MASALDAAKLKIVRAQEHLNSLNAEQVMFWLNHSHTFRREIEGDLMTIVPSVEADPPLRWSAIIGDCLTNARASLDILFFGLIDKHFVPKFDIANRNDRRITAFPIWSADGEQGYRDRLKSLAKRQIPGAVIDEVESVQPNKAGNEPLKWLNSLVNTDKHRMILLTVGIVGSAQIVMWQPPDGIRRMVSGASIRSGATFKTNPTMMAAINDGSMQVDVQATIDITWKDVSMPSEPVEVTLGGIVTFTRDIVEKLGRFL